MSDGITVIDLKGLTKPATVLIEKISEAVAGLYKPYQIRRVAQADADADIIKAQAQIEITNLQRRALGRFLAEEAKKQENMERITEKAIPNLADSSAPEKMDDDWITNFFDKCRIVSDEEMQSLWAKVLAGEANASGTYSKRTVNFLGSLDKQDAHLFTSLCKFAWWFGEPMPLIYDVEAAIYSDQGVNFRTITHLDDIGLVSFDPGSGFQRSELPQRILGRYYRMPLVIEFNKPEKNALDIGKVLLTRTGAQLFPICGSEPAEEFCDYVIKRWASDGLILSCPFPRET